MSTLVYSPGIRVKIRIRNGADFRVIDVTKDISSGSLTRTVNAQSSLNLTLGNTHRKYDGVFTPNDSIHVQMKRVRWIPVFTGYLDTVPFVSSFSRDVSLSASCSIKRLQHTYWDPGLLESVRLLRFDPQDLDGPSNGDGGLSHRLIRLMTEVGRWREDQIHVGAIPSSWLEQLTSAREVVTEQLSEMQSILGPGIMSGGVGGGGPSSAIELGPNHPNPLPGDLAQFSRLPYTSGKVSWFAGPKDSSTLNGLMALTGEPGRAPHDNHYLAMRWGYWTGSSTAPAAVTNVQTIKNWLKDRRVVIRAVKTQRQIVVRPADWGPAAWAKDVDISESALTALGIATNDEVQVSWAPDGTRLGLVGGGGIGGGGTGGMPLIPSVDDVANQFNASAPESWAEAIEGTSFMAVTEGDGPGAGAEVVETTTDTVGPGLVFPIVSGDVRGDPGYSQSYCAPRTATRRHAGIDISSEPAGRCVAAEDSVVISIGQTATYSQGTAWRVNVRGVQTDIVYSYTHVQNHLNPERTVKGRGFLAPRPNLEVGQPISKGEVFCAIYIANGWHLHFEMGHPEGYNGALPGVCPGRAGNNSGSSGVPNHFNPYSILQVMQGLSDPISGGGIGIGGGLDLIRGFDWYGVEPNPESQLLYGIRALMNDEPLLGTVQSIARAGLRDFSSAPNGDFVAWFPDHFGMYGTASRIFIRDIEVKDFTISWSDTNLITHQFVAGRQPGSYGGAPGGGAVASYLKQVTEGIATIELPGLLKAILNVEENEDGEIQEDAWYHPTNLLNRFGARPSFQQMTNITGPEAEFFYAVHMFRLNWAKQFNANIPITFMPEAWPGMLGVFSDRGFQVYIQSVTHTFGFSEGGGFDTTLTVMAPSTVGDAPPGIYGLPRSNSRATPFIRPGLEPIVTPAPQRPPEGVEYQ